MSSKPSCASTATAAAAAAVRDEKCPELAAAGAEDPYESLQIRESNALYALCAYSKMTTKNNDAYSMRTTKQAPFSCALIFTVDGEHVERGLCRAGFATAAEAREEAAACALNVIDAVRMHRHAAACYQAAIERRADMHSAFESWCNSYVTMRGGRSKKVDNEVSFSGGLCCAIVHYELLSIPDDGNNAARTAHAQYGWGFNKEEALDTAAHYAFANIGKVPVAMARGVPPSNNNCGDSSSDGDDDAPDLVSATAIAPHVAEPAVEESAAKDTLTSLRNTLSPSFRLAQLYPQVDLAQYYKALAGKSGWNLSMTLDDDAFFRFSAEFDVENEVERRKVVGARGYYSWKEAVDAAATAVLDIIDAVRMKQHAGECYDACISEKANVFAVWSDWCDNYTTMRRANFKSMKQVAWNDVSHCATMRFGVLCIVPSGNSVACLSRCVQSMRADPEKAYECASEHALLLIADRPYHGDDVVVPLKPPQLPTPNAPARDCCEMMANARADAMRRVPPPESFRIKNTKDPNAAVGEYYDSYRNAYGNAGWSFSITKSPKYLYGGTATFAVERVFEKYKVSVDGFLMWEEAASAAAKLSLDVIDAVRMQQHAGACYDACIAAKTSMFAAFSKWYDNYATMRGVKFSKAENTTFDGQFRCNIICPYLLISLDGNKVENALGCACGLCDVKEQAQEDAARDMLLIIAGRSLPIKETSKPPAEPLTDVSATPPPLCPVTVYKPKERSDALRKLRITESDPRAALSEYQRALGCNPAYYICTIMSENNIFHSTASVYVENEPEKRTAKVTDCVSRLEAETIVTTKLLNIIDAVRMRIDAAECMAKCMVDTPQTRNIPNQWISSYHTMRDRGIPSEVEYIGIPMIAGKSDTRMRFKYWRIDDGGNDASFVEHTISGTGNGQLDSLRNVMRNAVEFIEFGGLKKSEGDNNKPTAALPYPERFMVSFQRLHALCCALEPAKDSKLRPIYHEWVSPTVTVLGKTVVVNAELPLPDDGGVAYMSPNINVGTDCATVDEAKEMAACYVLYWIRTQIFNKH